VAIVKTGNPLTSKFAVRRLGWFGPLAAEAVPTLVDALGNEYIRNDAVDALRKIGPAAKAAVPFLVKLQDESLVGNYAKEALKEINQVQPQSHQPGLFNEP
jgi:HEAT repeat protein